MIGDLNVKDIRVYVKGWNTDFEGAVRSGLEGDGATNLEMSWIARAVANGQHAWDDMHFCDGMGKDGAIIGVLGPRSPITTCRCEGSVPWDE
ncbi:hypothetical protein [Streptomyces antibioticus]|uniref:hypothetical protein n=1 Tax=Streptomyces antibioticus TaxID=1890 RepID=UPI0033A04E88